MCMCASTTYIVCIIDCICILGGWFHCMLHHLAWQLPWICIDCEGCCILLPRVSQNYICFPQQRIQQAKSFLFASFEFWVEPWCWDSVFVRWYVVMMYLWNSGIWASGAVWGCQWTEASIPHPSWTPPESSSHLQSHRNLKKRNFQKREKNSSWSSLPSPSPFFPPPPSSTTLSVKTTSSTLSGCLCRKPPPPPYSLFHLHDHPVHHLLAQPSRNLELGLQTKLKWGIFFWRNLILWPNGTFALTLCW